MRVGRGVLALFSVLSVSALDLPSASAQSGDPSTWSAPGFKEGRAHDGQEPWEQIDTLNGGVTLRFTDFDLPGDNGFRLLIQRVWNSKGLAAGWRIGIGDVPMWIRNHAAAWGPPTAQSGFGNGYPILEMLDGTEHPAVESPTPNTWKTGQHAYFRKDAGTLRVDLPNGLVCVYRVLPQPTASGQTRAFLETIGNPYGEVARIIWNDGNASSQPTIHAVEHYVANAAGEIRKAGGVAHRRIEFEYEGGRPAQARRDRLQRDLLAVGLRVGEHRDGLGSGEPQEVVLRVDHRPGPRRGGDEGHDALRGADHLPVPTVGHRLRPRGRQHPDDRGHVARGPAVSHRAGRDLVVCLSVLLGRRRHDDDHGPDGTRWGHYYGPGGGYPIGDANPLALLSISTTTPAGTLRRTEQLEYEPYAYSPNGGGVALRSRQIEQDGRRYLTEYAYSPDPLAFGDFSQPRTITEFTGPATGSLTLKRTTQRTYNRTWMAPTTQPFFTPQLATESVTAGAHSYSNSFTYNGNAFLTHQSQAGVKAEFGWDARGNRVAETGSWQAEDPEAASRAVTHVFEFGVPKTTTIPKGTGGSGGTIQIDRTIDVAFGTVLSVSRGGATTTFEVDALGRPRGDDSTARLRRSDVRHLRSRSERRQHRHRRALAFGRCRSPGRLPAAGVHPERFWPRDPHHRRQERGDHQDS